MRPILASILLLTTFFTMSSQTNAQNKPKGRINHMALSVTDLQKSAPFYRDIIGLDTIPEPFHDGKHIWFSIGDKAHLHLIENRKPHDPVPNKNTHLCFSTNRLDQLIALLNERKIPFEDWAGHPSGVTRRVDGIRQIWFQDPDGYWIEVNDDF